MILAPILMALIQQPAPGPSLPVRPRDPFVFRCVLDKRARMITAALDDDMWVAWDATNCGLYKAWKGGVNFDGPVYTTVHGPQPTSRGNEYTSGPEGDVWTVYAGDKLLDVRATYDGYTLEAGRVALEWRFAIAPGHEVFVTERPEFVRPRQVMTANHLEDAVLGDGLQPGLQRNFEAVGLAGNERVCLTIRTDGVVGKIAGALELEQFEDLKDEHGNVTATRVWSQMPLSKASPRNGVVLFFQPIAPESPKGAAPQKAAPNKSGVK